MINWKVKAQGLYMGVTERGIGVIADPNLLRGQNGLEPVLEFLYFEGESRNVPDWDTEYRFRQLVIERFIKQEFNSKLEVAHLRGWFLTLVMAEVALWQSTLKMLERLQTLGYLTLPTTIEFLYLVNERSLLMLTHLDEEALSSIRGKESYTTRLQRQNRQLQGLDGTPFDINTSPHTLRIFDAAIKVANQHDQFRKEFFTPVVRSRMKLVKQLSSSSPKLAVRGKIIRQGDRTLTRNIGS